MWLAAGSVGEGIPAGNDVTGESDESVAEWTLVTSNRRKTASASGERPRTTNNGEELTKAIKKSSTTKYEVNAGKRCLNAGKRCPVSAHTLNKIPS